MRISLLRVGQVIHNIVSDTDAIVVDIKGGAVLLNTGEIFTQRNDEVNEWRIMDEVFELFAVNELSLKQYLAANSGLSTSPRRRFNVNETTPEIIIVDGEKFVVMTMYDNELGKSVVSCMLHRELESMMNNSNLEYAYISMALPKLGDTVLYQGKPIFRLAYTDLALCEFTLEIFE